MTTGELLASESTVSNVSALIHLQNIAGTGTGQDVYIPYTDVSVDFVEDVLKVDFIDDELVVEFSDDIIEVDFEEDIMLVTFEEENLDISVTCE